jgi:energy-coupling factor transporter ATP-binding protein EcfA2
MAATLNKGINLSQTGLLYNPQLQDADTVEKLFVVRRKQFEFLLNKVLQEKRNSIPQHHLIIGQRGMGKTTLLKRMEVELHKEQYRRQFIPLLYREEQYNVKDLAEFWLNTLDALADSLQSEKYPARMVADTDKIIMELSGKTPEMISEEAHKYLLDICCNLHRRPVLLIDNIGLIFSRLDNDKKNKTESWALRKLLSENGAPIVISVGNTLIDSVNNYGMPFYDFFQIQKLYKLSYDEFTKLLINLTTITDRDKTILASIQENSSRQRSLFELTGGSPRVTVMLFEQIAKGFSSNICDDLEKLADSITPLYKARFEELPAQQQIILDAIALNWDAIPLNKLSTTTRMKNNQLSPQLKRLVDDGWIETTSAYKAKGNAYFISERFFNIYYLIRNSSRRHKDKIYCLSKFLECFYGKEDPDEPEAKHFGRRYLDKILFELQNNNKGIAREYLLQAFEVLEKEDKISSIANKNWWIRFGSVVIKLNCGSWLLAVLEEKGYNIVLSPYYTAVQALEIEQQDGKKDAETYLNNRAVEISNPARIIAEKIKKYLS